MVYIKTSLVTGNIVTKIQYHVHGTRAMIRHVRSDSSQPLRHHSTSQVCLARTPLGTKKLAPRGEADRRDLQSIPPHSEREEQECEDLLAKRRGNKGHE